jgi:hypothetical protein
MPTLRSACRRRRPARSSSAEGQGQPGRRGRARRIAAGTATLSFHLEFARAVLDAIKPNPSDDPAAALWYRATSAALARAHDHADAIVHLRRAWQLFPGDATIFFDAGCLYETFASPAVQAVLLRRIREKCAKASITACSSTWISSAQKRCRSILF